MARRALVTAVLALLLMGVSVFAGFGAGSQAQSLEGYKICVDAGHGGYDPGAVGYVVEKDVNLGIALKLAELLGADGASVVLTRSSDTFVSLQERVAIANSEGCDIFVSIHANAAASSLARGIEVYHYPSSSKGRALAEDIYAYLKSETGLPGRFVGGAYFYVLVHTVMPAVLVETGFVTNQSDAAFLGSEAGQWKAAYGILYGIQEYFGVEPHDPLYTRVVDVRVGDHGSFVRFVIDLSRAADYADYYWQDPQYLAVRVYDAKLSVDPADGWVSLGNGWYKKDTGIPEVPKIYVRQYGDDVLVVLATQKQMDYTSFTLTSPDRIVLDLERNG